MSKIKVKKLPIILPLLLLIVILTAYTLINTRGATAASSLSLGQQYLNKLDYGGAIAAFTRAVELDPNNSTARVGLAQAYAGLGEYDFAEEVLSEMVYTGSPEEEATMALLDIYRSADKDIEAIGLVQVLISTTDKDDYYKLRNELLADHFDLPCSIAQGSAHELLIDNGKLLSRGNNRLGQLGTAPNETGIESFTSADFSGTAVNVACINSTSLVIDSEGRLWAAGENRWGQYGIGYASTSTVSGWQEIPLNGNAADIAGTAGRLLVLLTDGSLWQSGAGEVMQLTRLDKFSTVIGLASTPYYVIILTADGALWRSDAYDPDLWTKIADNVSAFSVSDNSICWIDNFGYINCYSGWFSLPNDWYDGTGYACPEANICGLAASSNALLLRSTDGRLFAVINGISSEVAISSQAVNTYVVGDTIVIEHNDGSVSFVDSTDFSLHSIDEY